MRRQLFLIIYDFRYEKQKIKSKIVEYATNG